jgi:hypothetical protein
MHWAAGTPRRKRMCGKKIPFSYPRTDVNGQQAVAFSIEFASIYWRWPEGISNAMPILRPRIRMGQNRQNRGPMRPRIPNADGRGVRDDPNTSQIWAAFAWPLTPSAGRLRPPLAHVS